MFKRLSIVTVVLSGLLLASCTSQQSADLKTTGDKTEKTTSNTPKKSTKSNKTTKSTKSTDETVSPEKKILIMNLILSKRKINKIRQLIKQRLIKHRINPITNNKIKLKSQLI